VFDGVTNTKLVGAKSSYLSKNLALNIKVEKVSGDTLIDESYLAIARGNYSLTLGSKKNWWGNFVFEVIIGVSVVSYIGI
jgi:hypothetical protein